MNRKYVISIGTDTVQSVNKNTFTEFGLTENHIAFVPKKKGLITPDEGEVISMERRRKYQFYEKE